MPTDVELNAAADAAMERYAAGDETAFADVYDALAPRLLAYLRRMTGHPERAEDLLQLTMLHIHRARGTFIPGAETLPWAFAIARRLAIDLARHERRQSSRAGNWNAGTATATGPSAEELMGAHQLALRVRTVLAGLPVNQRTAFELVKRDGLSLREAANRLGTSVAAVKLRASRAYAALRAAIAGDDRDGTA